GCVAVPCAEDPIATIYPDAEGWWLEGDELVTPLAPGQLFQVAGRSWRFECPAGAAITATSLGSFGLDDVTLLFGVSRDQEHVSLTLQGRSGEQPLGERTCYYLALILAKQRQVERARADAGWVDVDRFVRMAPEYAAGSALNVEIFRLRRALGEAGLHDAAAIVQRRRRQLRLGTERFEIREA
ncbi:MAG TPA: hypothetical protein VNN80_33205, partial [Polyangiaceae bacterium]|nr:hypothetical protein [Polyangiaceae bacterium]